jgi:hypothetical protein
MTGGPSRIGSPEIILIAATAASSLASGVATCRTRRVATLRADVTSVLTQKGPVNRSKDGGEIRGRASMSRYAGEGVSGSLDALPHSRTPHLHRFHQ